MNELRVPLEMLVTDLERHVGVFSVGAKQRTGDVAWSQGQG